MLRVVAHQPARRPPPGGAPSPTGPHPPKRPARAGRGFGERLVYPVAKKLFPFLAAAGGRSPGAEDDDDERKRSSSSAPTALADAPGSSSSSSAPPSATTFSPLTPLPASAVAEHPKLRTVSGQPVRAFALGGNREVRQPRALAPEARLRGVNYFFAYSMRDDQIGDYLDGLAEVCGDPIARKNVFVAVGIEDFTDRDAVTAHVERCLARLGTDYVDAFFLEYVCRGDEDAAIETLRWMRGAGGLVVREGGRAGIDGCVRFVGCSTHDRCVGARLLKSERQTLETDEEKIRVIPETTGDAETASCEAREAAAKEEEEVERDPNVFEGSNSSDDGSETTTVSVEEEVSSLGACELDLLMARYNMAHAKAEWRLFPLAAARDVPVVAFTSTRWNTLQRGHPRWEPNAPPDVSDCMAWAAHHDAVRVVLNAPADVATLEAWTSGLARRGGDAILMGEEEVARWRRYGEMVYDEGAPFETMF